MATYTYKGWTVTHKGSSFTASKAGFFTSYHDCGTTGQFLDILDKQYGRVA